MIFALIPIILIAAFLSGPAQFAEKSPEPDHPALTAVAASMMIDANTGDNEESGDGGDIIDVNPLQALGGFITLAASFGFGARAALKAKKPAGKNFITPENYQKKVQEIADGNQTAIERLNEKILRQLGYV